MVFECLGIFAADGTPEHNVPLRGIFYQFNALLPRGEFSRTKILLHFLLLYSRNDSEKWKE